MSRSVQAVWVSALADLGRGDARTMGGDHIRTMAQYEQWLLALLALGQKTVVFIDEQTHERVWQQLSDEVKKSTDFRALNRNDWAHDFEYYEAVQAKRLDPAWYQKAPWLGHSPQAKLADYNPLVMSKVRWLSQCAAEHDDPAQGFYWLDAGLIRTCPNLVQHHDWGQWLAEQTDRCVIASFLYVGGDEIHGFDRSKMARLCQTDYVDYVVRGGFFGGQASAITRLNERYYPMLEEAFALDDMGTEENILTALAHRYPEDFFRFELKDDGLIWPMIEALGQRAMHGVVAEHQSLPAAGLVPKPRPAEPPKPTLEVYVLTFNSAAQLQSLIHSWEDALHVAEGVTVIDNSTDASVVKANRALCQTMGYQHIPQGNLGICGGRLMAALAFEKTQASHALFLEDDMLASQQNGLCRSGLPQKVDHLLPRALKAMVELELDLLKLSYSELFGTHRAQWAWCHLSGARQRALDPQASIPHPPIDDEQLPPTRIEHIRVAEGLPVAVGEPHYSNWPHLISQRGNRRLFMEPQWVSPHEGAFMAQAFELQRLGLLRSGVLLASPIHHCREHDYDPEERLECR